MFYRSYEYQRAVLEPFTVWAQAVAKSFTDPANPLAYLPGAAKASAAYELFYRLGKDYEKPEFGIRHIEKEGYQLPVVEQIILKKPFCHLLYFKRYTDNAKVLSSLNNDSTVLVCAPLSGHHATLLRDTVQTLLQNHNVYVTDWIDARMVPFEKGAFHLDDYVAYIETFIRHIGARRLHIISVCQPTVPVLAAVSLMATRGEDTPLSLTLMGGPIDARKNPTSVNSLATERSYEWFENNVISTIPLKYPGVGRKVYPGFLQHAGFVAMNPSRHFASHWDFYLNLLRGDEEDAAAHRRFYDEYNAVMDIPAEYYLETIRFIFQEFRLAKGNWHVNGERVKPQDIKRTALMTIEGELDDISGNEQTQAAHALCTGIAKSAKQHFTAKKCGHYGIFSGKRWRTLVYPKINAFIKNTHQNSN